MLITTTYTLLFFSLHLGHSQGVHVLISPKVFGQLVAVEVRL